MFFVILVTHPKRRRFARFRRQTSKWRWGRTQDGCYCENSGIL